MVTRKERPELSVDQHKLLSWFVEAEEEGVTYGCLAQGMQKIWARELEALGLARFVDYYHGDPFWRATSAGVELINDNG